MERQNQNFHILSIDGGGFRGAYAAHILSRIENTHSTHWHRDFDLVAGTSTGAIIAAAIAGEIPISRVLNLYKQHGHTIFKKRKLFRHGLLASKFRSNPLRKVLKQEFGEMALGDIKKPLIIPATDISNGCVHVFKSGYDPEFTRDQNVRVRDAVLASCSAPTYFDPMQINSSAPYLLADGGVWANNPSLVATIESKHRLGQNLDHVRVLSIGTGESKQHYPFKKSKKNFFGWGFAGKWGGSRFIEMILNLQSQKDANMLGLLLKNNQVVRINFKSDSSLPLDDPDEWDDLLSRADRDYTHQSNNINQFIRKEEINND